MIRITIDDQMINIMVEAPICERDRVFVKHHF